MVMARKTGNNTAASVMGQEARLAEEARVMATALNDRVSSSASSSSLTDYEEAARIVQTLIDGGRAKRVEQLEVMTEVPEGGVTLPVVADGKLKTMSTDTIIAQMNKNFEAELNKLVVGQVPFITDEEITEITKIDTEG